VALKLINKGIFAVKVLKGDFLEWETAGYPTEGMIHN
jgi:rhodanese-related sulfurtransferase